MTPVSGYGCKSPPVQYYVALVCTRMRDLTFMARGLLFWSRCAIVDRCSRRGCIGSSLARLPIPYSVFPRFTPDRLRLITAWVLVPDSLSSRSFLFLDGTGQCRAGSSGSFSCCNLHNLRLRLPATQSFPYFDVLLQRLLSAAQAYSCCCLSIPRSAKFFSGHVRI